jgi:hypothetical protein
MQFGKVQGIALMALGFLLIGIQAMVLMSPRNDVGRTEGSTKTVESKISMVPGIVGGVSLIAGYWIFFTARRSDEPAPKDAVK